MKKRTKLLMTVAVLLSVIGITVGLVGLCMMDGDWSQLANEPSITSTHELTDPFSNIVIEVDTADVIVIPASDGKSCVKTLDTEKYHHEVSVENGTLTIRLCDNRKWYDKIGFYSADTKVVLSLDASTYALLTVKGSTCDVSVQNGLLFEAVDIKTSTGNVSFDAQVAGALSIKTSTGDVEIVGASAGALSVRTSTGKTVIKDSSFATVSIVGRTGGVKLADVTAQVLSITTHTGDVELIRSDAEELAIATDTGDVEGSLLSGKIFEVKTDTGKVQVPQSDPSGGFCRITTDTGDVKITVG